MVLEEYKDYVKKINASKNKPTYMQLQACFEEAQIAYNTYPDDKVAFDLSDYAKSWCKSICQTSKDSNEIDDFWQLYWEILKWESPYLFDSYMLYLEKDRPIKERFYQPRRKQLTKLGVIQALQDIEDDKYDILTISLPPGTGKTTIMKFFISWKIGRSPEMYNLFYSHSDGITRMFYDGVLDITSNRDYRFYDIFPDLKLIKTDAKAQQLTFNQYKPFPNLQTGTIDSNLAGRVRCNGYLLCDDLIGKKEQALNKTYLDKLWEVKYTGDAKQRKMTGCKEIHIATRWSVHDIIGRIITLLGNDKRARFITIDCYDENRQSQFDYDYGVGLTTEFLNNQELFMDSITFNALYRGQTVEREGLLYIEDSIRRYLELPDGEPDAIMGICDTKNKGTDYFFLPCFYVYGNDHYLVDCVCNNSSDYGIQYGNATDLIISHNMQQVEFESNNGGDRVSFEVANRVRERGGRCNITNRPTESNKETKIIVNADWVKKHVLFKDMSLYDVKSDYATMMNFLLSYTVAGKNTHDDIPDGMAMYALFVTRKMNVRRKAYVMKSPI